MKFSSAETVFKTYDYDVLGVNLIITNRRVISRAVTAYGMRAHEINISDIKSVSYGVEMRRHIGFLIAAVAFLLTAVALLAMYFGLNIEQNQFFLVGAGVAFAAALLFLILYYVIKKLAFFLSFNLACEYKSALKLFQLNSSLTLSENGYSSIRVTITNEKRAQQVVDEIGAIIIDVQNGVLPKTSQVMPKAFH